MQLILGYGAFNLNPVAAPMAEAWVCESLLEAPLICEEQQPLTVCIKPACCINLWNPYQVSQTSPSTAWFRGELAEDPVGLMEQKGGQPAFSRALHRLTTPIEISSSPRSMVRGGRITDCIVSRRGA